MSDTFDRWLDGLEKRHLADLRPSEVNRGVRALSDDYVHRRHRVAGDALSGRGKRAAFALFFAPLHFLVVRDVTRALDLSLARIERIVDLGCGTGAAAAAVSSVLQGPISVVGVDRQGWTLQEAASTYREFGLRHRVLRGDVRHPRIRLEPGTLVLLAYTVNELDAAGRAPLLHWLCATLTPHCALLIVEPVARTVTPWWGEWISALRPLGAVEHEFRFGDPLPHRLRLMDRAAGLNHQVRAARALWVAPRRG